MNETPLKDTIAKDRIPQGLSVIVPIYNEAFNLASFMEELEKFFSTFQENYEIVIVDDGSDDGTSEQLESCSYKVIRHEVNLGYGAAVKTGIRNSRYDKIAMLDSDGTYSPQEIETLLPYLKYHDMVVGARTGEETYHPFLRKPAKWIIRHFASWLVRRPIPDLNSGLRLFRREPVEKLLQLLPDGFSLTTTLTVAFHASGRKVYYQSISYLKRAGQSKFRPLADTWNMILLILRTVVLIRPLNVFLPLSFFLAFLALLILVVSKTMMEQFMDATFIVLMMGSIQMFVLGLIADLIVRINLWTH